MADPRRLPPRCRPSAPMDLDPYFAGFQPAVSDYDRINPAHMLLQLRTLRRDRHLSLEVNELRTTHRLTHIVRDSRNQRDLIKHIYELEDPAAIRTFSKYGRVRGRLYRCSGMDPARECRNRCCAQIMIPVEHVIDTPPIIAVVRQFVNFSAFPVVPRPHLPPYIFCHRVHLCLTWFTTHPPPEELEDPESVVTEDTVKPHGPIRGPFWRPWNLSLFQWASNEFGINCCFLHAYEKFLPAHFANVSTLVNPSEDMTQYTASGDSYVCQLCYGFSTRKIIRWDPGCLHVPVTPLKAVQEDLHVCTVADVIAMDREGVLLDNQVNFVTWNLPMEYAELFVWLVGKDFLPFPSYKEEELISVTIDAWRKASYLPSQMEMCLMKYTRYVCVPRAGQNIAHLLLDLPPTLKKWRRSQCSSLLLGLVQYTPWLFDQPDYYGRKPFDVYVRSSGFKKNPIGSVQAAFMLTSEDLAKVLRDALVDDSPEEEGETMLPVGGLEIPVAGVEIDDLMLDSDDPNDGDYMPPSTESSQGQ